MTKPHIICWDLDLTLGIFDDKEKKAYHKPKYFSYVELVGSKPQYDLVKPKIRQVLKSLSEQGFQHHVTSFSIQGLVKEYVDRVGLTDYFSGLWGREKLSNDMTGEKDYQKLFESQGYSVPEAQDKSIIISNGASDFCSTVPGIVSMVNQNAFRTNAKVEVDVLEHLRKIGEGSFYRGFQNQ